MSCLFLGFKDFSFFHLLSHAIFKSLLFLCSGIIIHLISGCQDIRMMGSICFRIPLTCGCFNISNMALCGFPFLSGFYSKDLIIEYSSFKGLNLLILSLIYLRLGLTSFYTFRLIYYTIMVKFNYLSFLILRDDISIIKWRIVFLGFFSVSFGSIYIWLTNLDIIFLILPSGVKLLSLIMVLLGFWLRSELSKFKNNIIISNFNGSM
jgi:NADH-ubiquinone oxidoreductase chain 5